ncbi:IS3 family transposase, partial [Paraclostridium bifermentans]|uniref:IS3 family transposase n=1 Tax=Paraclostridium bifermentans TaxID=1490 RepID=UPI001D5D7C7F
MVIKSMSSKYSISTLCKLVNLSRSGYYKWLKRTSKLTDRDIQDSIIKCHILDIHKKYRGTYGRKRICIYLNRILDFTINHKRVYRLMKELNIQSVIRKKVYKRKFKPSKIAANILNRNFKSNKPLEKICMDITYIPIGKKFIYINAAKDLFNGEIVAYDISTRIDNVLVQNTLKQLNRMNLDENCILHTDQGSQYTNQSYCSKLKSNGIIQSMSRRGNCWDNAPIESFFSHLKSELIYLVQTNDQNEIIKLIHDYIYFYNNERIQLKNGMSPVEYR